jgi:hypothetical protein
MRITQSEKDFSDGKRNDYFCSIGFHHVLVEELKDTCKMMISCQRLGCTWSVITTNPLQAAIEEEKHLLIHNPQ